MAEERRSFALELDLPARPEEVWEALTQASELTRWFPLQAEVTPGVGGSVTWSWDGAWTWTSRIAGWEPGRRLLLLDELARPFDADGAPLPEGAAQPAKIAMEFTLEVKGGRAARLRLVHSGFGHGAAWDDELDGIRHGWAFELRSLAHYLGRHRGRQRHAAHAQVTTQLPCDEVWKRLLGRGGFELSPWPPAAGQPYTITGAGERFSGEVLIASRDRQFAGTTRELGDGLFRIETWRAGGEVGVLVGASSWSEESAPRMKAFVAQAQGAVEGVLAGG